MSMVDGLLRVEQVDGPSKLIRLSFVGHCDKHKEPSRFNN